jgi:hypothetical protein
MLENLLIGLTASALLVGGILAARRQRKIRLARRHREHLLSLIGLSDSTPGRTAPDRQWWGSLKTWLPLK